MGGFGAENKECWGCFYQLCFENDDEEIFSKVNDVLMELLKGFLPTKF